MEYTYTDEKLSNGNTIRYKITKEGTAYHRDTPDRLVELLERLRNNHTRVRVYLGDKETGKDWEESYDVFGTIGRSGGRIKIPLLINNRRSMGGGSLLDDAIVKLEYANKRDGGVIWEHPNYHRGDYPLETRTHYKKVVRKTKSKRSSSPPMSLGSMR